MTIRSHPYSKAIILSYFVVKAPLHCCWRKVFGRLGMCYAVLKQSASEAGESMQILTRTTCLCHQMTANREASLLHSCCLCSLPNTPFPTDGCLNLNHIPFCGLANHSSPHVILKEIIWKLANCTNQKLSCLLKNDVPLFEFDPNIDYWSNRRFTQTCPIWSSLLHVHKKKIISRTARMYIYMINLIYITAFQEKITATFMLIGVKAARVRTMGKKCSELSSDMWVEALT